MNISILIYTKEKLQRENQSIKFKSYLTSYSFSNSSLKIQAFSINLVHYYRSILREFCLLTKF